MKIKKMIEKLQELQKHYGDDVPVYFDCPQCAMSFSPGIVVTKTLHLRNEEVKK